MYLFAVASVIQTIRLLGLKHWVDDRIAYTLANVRGTIAIIKKYVVVEGLMPFCKT